MKLLHIDSSILSDNSVSRQISAAIVAAKLAAHPGTEVTYRDLAIAPLAHLSGAVVATRFGAADAGPDIQRDIAAGDAALAEFMAADTVVIGAPMYNFTVPSQLKAWIDRILVAGATFRYTEHGAEGLATGKRVIVASSRGGFYGPGAPSQPFEHQESYLRSVFAFIGIPDVAFVHAEGLAMGPEQRDEALASAKARVAELAC